MRDSPNISHKASANKFRRIESEVGSLVPISFIDLPFIPQRVFVVQDVPPGTTRGIHAHRQCDQYLLLLSGEVRVRMSDGELETQAHLQKPGAGVHLRPMIWGSQTYVTRNTELLVFASHEYDRSDYIEDFDEFLREKRASAKH